MLWSPHTPPCLPACPLSHHPPPSLQTMLDEAVAIVMAPKDPSKRVGIFRLTTPGGLKLVQRCPQRGFHAHPPTDTGQPIYELCGHVVRCAGAKDEGYWVLWTATTGLQAGRSGRQLAITTVWLGAGVATQAVSVLVPPVPSPACAVPQPPGQVRGGGPAVTCGEISMLGGAAHKGSCPANSLQQALY